MLIAFGLVCLMFVILVGAVGLGGLLLYGSGNILPGVSVAGIEVGGMSEAEAVEALSSGWQSQGILLRDGERTWAINPGELGLSIEAQASAAAARSWGRSQGGIFGGIEALISGAEVEPHLLVNLDQASVRLEQLRTIIEQPAKNAGIQLVNGQAQVIPPVQGRVLDINATLTGLQTDAATELADGALDLAMVPVAPGVTDATPLLQEAQALLSRSMNIDAYDPVTNESQVWTLAPSEWGQWLVATQNPTSPTGLALSLDQSGLRGFLESRASQFSAPRYLKVDESIEQINAAMATNQLDTWIRVYHQPSAYTVQAGDSISSIGYDQGIPYPWIQAANPGIDSLSPGQQISLPSKDDLLPLPIVRHKRIVLSINNQEMWAYENGQLKWNWTISTGISRSPTSPGIFQIQSHEINAYASQWNLYMPHFMGVYQPGPGADVMNGFHGFPTDASGGYLLWTSNLGRPATYGCILLSLENAEVLYNWAEEGVVVEIQR